VLLGLLVTGFIGSFQAHQPRQGRRTASLQPQGRIRRIMPLLLARMMVIIAFQREEPEDAIDRELRPALALPAGFGLVSRVDAVGGLLQQIGDHLVG